MVDPNRKINRLTEEDVLFLDECEELFGNRFSEEDKEFMEHCSKSLKDPPVVQNFTNGNVGRYKDNRSQYNGRGGNRGITKRNHIYRRGRNGDNYRSHRNDYGRYEERGRSTNAMNYRRDYGNFVHASSDTAGS